LFVFKIKFRFKKAFKSTFKKKHLRLIHNVEGFSSHIPVQFKKKRLLDSDQLIQFKTIRNCCFGARRRYLRLGRWSDIITAPLPLRLQPNLICIAGADVEAPLA